MFELKLYLFNYYTLPHQEYALMGYIPAINRNTKMSDTLYLKHILHDQIEPKQFWLEQLAL